MKEVCNGKINSNGICEKCYEVSQTTSAYCSRLIETEQETNDANCIHHSPNGFCLNSKIKTTNICNGTSCGVAEFIEQENPSEAIAKEEITEKSAEIYQKCHQCGNELPKQLHCPECGNNFPYFNASQKHLPTDSQVNEYLNNVTGDAYRWRIQEFWQWVKSNIK